MRRIAFINQKGGVGKTTCCVNVAAALARKGKSILLVDCDPQAHATIHLGVEPHNLKASLYDVMIGERAAAEVLISDVRPSLSLIPSNLDLSAVEVEIAANMGRENLLKSALLELFRLRKYDFVLLDCPPSLGLLSINALCVAREVFIPVQTEFLALQGLSKLLEIISLVKRRLNPILRVRGVIATMFDGRTRLAKEVLEDVRNFFGERVFRTVINKNVRLAEAPGFGKTIFEYDRTSRGAEDFNSLADEILAQPHI